MICKLYLKFTKKDNEDWFYMPLLIMSCLFTFNIYILALFFLELKRENALIAFALFILLYFILIFRFSKMKNKEFILNFNLNRRSYYLIFSIIILDFLFLISILNYVRSANMIR